MVRRSESQSSDSVALSRRSFVEPSANTVRLPGSNNRATQAIPTTDPNVPGATGMRSLRLSKRIRFAVASIARTGCSVIRLKA